LRLPLQMRYPAASGALDFAAPRLPAPWHMIVALVRAKGLTREDKLSLGRFFTAARWMGWRLDEDVSVSVLLERFGQSPRAIRLMWQPLCLAALNTPAERASANVFLATLRDSLAARRAASDMLIPKLELSALFPQAASRYLEAQGGVVRSGAKVGAVVRLSEGWLVETGQGGAQGDERFDAVVLATPPAAAAGLLAPFAETAALAVQLDAFDYEPIATCYLQYAQDLRLPLPFCALLDEPQAQRFGQFAFDRGQLDAAQNGLLAVVISAARDAAALDQGALAQAVAAQLAHAFGDARLGAPLWSRVITEKTAACRTPLAASQSARYSNSIDHTERRTGNDPPHSSRRRTARTAHSTAHPGLAGPRCRQHRRAGRTGTLHRAGQRPPAAAAADARARPRLTEPRPIWVIWANWNTSTRSSAHCSGWRRSCRRRRWPGTSSASWTASRPAAASRRSHANWTTRRRSP
jgi:hypothetical protein